MYSDIDLPIKGEVDGMKHRKRIHCFTQVLDTAISDVLASKKKK